MALSLVMRNFINGSWQSSTTKEFLPVVNPATAETMCTVPLSTKEEVTHTVSAASRALVEWRNVPATQRIQYLFKLKNLLESDFDDLARTITLECGKVLEESRGEMRRAIENVEVACGIPTMMQGYISEDIAPGIDELMIRQPVGVTAIIAPFNFPGMIPFWFLPYAIACGNTCIVKPSERVPQTLQKIFELIEKIDLPPGVLQLINGSKDVVDALLENPLVNAISMVGSTPVARYIYSKAAANGKRAQCQGGAKNISVVLPDADMETSTKVLADSAFGSAGQRCLATSIIVTVGSARGVFQDAISEAAVSRKVGFGLENGIEMGPVISVQSKNRIHNLIDKGLAEGSEILVDGRNPSIAGYEHGFFIRPTILKNIIPGGELFTTEVFGPVLGLISVDDLDEALHLVNQGSYGNMACIFTSNGIHARKFRNEANAGNIGVNIGVAAPMAFFPFSGWKESFFGDLHGQGWDAIEFFTQKKVIVERWPREWSRKF